MRQQDNGIAESKPNGLAVNHSTQTNKMEEVRYD
jgi:hypothetical protein